MRELEKQHRNEEGDTGKENYKNECGNFLVVKVEGPHEKRRGFRTRQ